MSKLTATEVRGMMEAYNAVYAPQQEVQELTLEIIENAAYVLFSQGYNVEDVISYFSEATEETIVEDFINFAEGNVILESVVVSDEYIEEQFIQLDEKIGGALKFLATQAGRAKQALGGIKQALTPAAKAPKPTPAPKQNILQAPSVTKPLNVTKPLPGNLAVTGGAKPQNILQRAASGAKELLKKVPGAGLASKLAKSPVGKLAGRIAPGAGVALGAMDAANRLKKGDIGGAALSGLGGALSAVPGGGTLAGLGVAGIQAATDAAGLTGDKSKKAPSAKVAPPKPQKALGGQTSFKAGGGQAALAKGKSMTDIQKAGSQALFKAGGGSAAMTQKGQTRAQVMAQGSKNVAPKPAAPEVKATNTIAAKPSQPPVAPAKPKTPSTPAGNPATGMLGKTSYQVRTPNRAEFKASQEYRQQNPNAKPEDVLKAAQDAGKAQKSVDADIEKFNKPEELNKPAPAGTALAAEQERRRKAAEQGKATAAQTKPQPVNASYEYDAYDLVLEYLFSEGHVDTVDEAHYVMLEMDSNTIQDIVEAKYGTAAGRKALAKKIRKGENIGKKGPGTGFKAVAKAAEKGGAEDPEAVAAAAMYKTYGGKKGKSHKEY